MRGPVRGVIFGLLLLCAGVLGPGLAPDLAPPAFAQAQPPSPELFARQVSAWTAQLDRISDRADQSGLTPPETDALRDQATVVRSAAAAAAQVARGELADTKRLLAPLQPPTGPDGKPLPDQPPESDAVKADRLRLTQQATASQGQLKQCEVVIARADQLLDRLGKLRNTLVLQTLLHRDPSPFSRQVWTEIGPEFAAAVQQLKAAAAAWSHDGLAALRSGDQDLTPLGWWAAGTIALWLATHALRRRYGRGELAEPGQRDRIIAAAIDGLGLVIVPILAVLLLHRLLDASRPPPPLDTLLTEFTGRVVTVLLVLGVAATALAPHRAPWRVLPFSDASAQHLATALRRLMTLGVAAGFIESALTQGPNHTALTSVGILILTPIIGFLTLPALANRAWEAGRPDGSDLPVLVGGTWWSVARLALSAVVLTPIAFAALGFTTLADHVHSATASTLLLVALALLAHRFAADGLDAIAAADTPTGRWVRGRFGLDPDAPLRGQYLVLLAVDFALVILLVLAIPFVWGADVDAIFSGAGHLLHGVKVGGVYISLENVGIAILTFALVLVLAGIVRAVVRDRVMPTVDAPLPLRQSIDAGLNYAGVIIAILVGVAALGIDFTNFAIVLGALSVGIGLGLQNIANNVISGVILLVERPIKAGDWVSVSGHEGFVRRINIRATEIETFQRTHVIVPNSVFLQNPVINRTYADTSSRLDIPLTVGLGTDVAKLEGILRELALDHPRVLRVPQPIVRFVRLAPAGLEFELFVFVAQLEDRTVVQNELNAAILARLIEEKIIDPAAVPRYRVDLEHRKLPSQGERKDDAAAPTTR